MAVRKSNKLFMEKTISIGNPKKYKKAGYYEFYRRVSFRFSACKSELARMCVKVRTILKSSMVCFDDET